MADVTDDANVPGPVEAIEQELQDQQQLQELQDAMYNDESREYNTTHENENKNSDHQHQDRTNVNSKSQRRTGVTAEAAPYDISYHPGRVLLYSPIRQRQKWGDPQVLPRVNWGDLFFDLFYVAATYNVSAILVDSASPTGLLYAMGTFLPVMGMWMDKVAFDSRYVCEDDLFHRLFQICVLVVLATAVLHIRVVDVLSHPDENISMFVFALSLVINRIFVTVRSMEIYFFGLGQTQILKTVAFTEMRKNAVSGSIYLAAMIIAGIEYFGSENDGSGRRGLAGAAVAIESSSSSGTNHIPISLCLAGCVFEQILFAIYVVFFFPGGGRHKESTVPLNIDFTLHRNGEWIMLMLGESVFSILIVEIPDNNSAFYATFYEGLLTVVLLQYLHFRSQPDHADHHAMRRSKNAGILWHLLQNAYSLALVSLGSAFTIFLTVFSSEEVEDDATSCRRWLAGDAETVVDGPLCRRWLAGGGEAKYDADTLKERAAHLFSGSLVIIFFCLDCMTILHLGVKESQERCVCKNSKKKNGKGLFLICLRVGLIVFCATLSQWLTEPEDLAGIGVACVLGQLVLRKLGGMFLSHNQVVHAEPGHHDAK